MHSEQGEYATASRRDSDSKSPSRRRRAVPAWMSATSNAIADPHAGMIECDGQLPDMAPRERLAEGRRAEDLFLELMVATHKASVAMAGSGLDPSDDAQVTYRARTLNEAERE